MASCSRPGTVSAYRLKRRAKAMYVAPPPGTNRGFSFSRQATPKASAKQRSTSPTTVSVLPVATNVAPPSSVSRIQWSTSPQRSHRLEMKTPTSSDFAW